MNPNTAKNLRVQIGTIENSIVFLNPNQELVMAMLNATRAKMFLGQVLKSLGTANPYPDSKDASNTKVEPTADATKESLVREWAEKGYLSPIQKIKSLRAHIDHILMPIQSELSNAVQDRSVKTNTKIFLEQAFISLTESQMWLGMAMAEINKEAAPTDTKQIVATELLDEAKASSENIDEVTPPAETVVEEKAEMVAETEKAIDAMVPSEKVNDLTQESETKTEKPKKSNKK